MAKRSDDACRLAILDECSLNDYGHKAADVYALAQTSRNTRSLIPSECRRLHMYRDMATSAVAGAFPLRYLSCFPGQDPITHPQVSFSQNIGTIIKSAAIVWADGGDEEIMRSFTGRGLRLAQGFVVCKSLSYHGMTSNFLIDRDRHHRAMGDQAGNSMPIPMIAVPIIWAILCVDVRADVELPASLSRIATGSRCKRSA